MRAMSKFKLYSDLAYNDTNGGGFGDEETPAPGEDTEKTEADEPEGETDPDDNEDDDDQLE